MTAGACALYHLSRLYTKTVHVLLATPVFHPFTSFEEPVRNTIQCKASFSVVLDS